MNCELRRFVAAVIAEEERQAAATADRMAALEAEGRVIVDGGQAGRDAWEIIDFRTRAVLAEGTGRAEEYDAACAQLDPGGTWIHTDYVDELVAEHTSRVEPPVPDGWPDSLAEAVADWAASASEEEIAALMPVTP